MYGGDPGSLLTLNIIGILNVPVYLW